MVLTIIAFVVTLGISRINKNNNDLKATLRRVSTLSKQLHSLAKLNSATYRIVFDLGGGEDKEKSQSYWVEKALGSVVLAPEDYEKKLDEQAGKKSEDEDAKKAPPSGGFQKDEKVVKGAKALPNGIKIESVESPASPEPITSGQAYIYFFPQGLADEAIVHLKAADKVEWSLAVRPLTGKMDIFDGKKTLKDLNQ